MVVSATTKQTPLPPLLNPLPPSPLNHTHLSVGCGGVSNVGVGCAAVCPQAGHQLSGVAVKVVADVSQADLTAVKVLRGGIDATQGHNWVGQRTLVHSLS